MTGEMRGLTTKVLGGRVIHLPSVDSTNNYLKENGIMLPHGTVCYTGRQVAGRGRQGRSWCAEDGQALAMSLLFKSEEEMPLLPLICGIAVAKALHDLSGGDFQIKWPNDIVCGGRKVCGILCEKRWAENEDFSIAGIGVNLRQTAEQFQDASLPYAASVKMLTGCELDIEDTAAAIISELEPLWLCLRDKGFSPLRAVYEELCVTVGRPVRVLSSDGSVMLEGVASGIADDGRLLVESGGKTVPVNAGEVSVRGLNGYV